MNCEEFDHLLDPYLDRELDPGQLIRLEQHLSDCPVCRSLVQECLDFRSFFRSNAPVYTAPPRLRTSVLGTVRRERLKSELAFLRRPWTYAAAVLFLGLAALTILIPDNAKELSGQAVARYTQSLAADHLVDIASSDQQARTLVRRQTQFYAAIGCSSGYWILPSGRARRCHPESSGGSTCLPAPQ